MRLGNLISGIILITLSVMGFLYWGIPWSQV